MVTITPNSDGTFSVESTTGPLYLRVTLTWVNAFLRELQDTGMIRLNGQVATRPRR